MKRNFIILCTVAFLVAALVQAQTETKKESAKKDGKQQPAKKIVVPFELLKTQHMVVNVKINGKGPYRLVFDTGAPDSLVSNKVAKEAGLVGKGGGLIPIFGARGQAKIKNLELGDLKAENVSTMILDHPTVQAIASFTGPIEGILGFTFYARYKMSIDYEKKLLTFEPNTYVPGDVMEAMLKQFWRRSRCAKAPRFLAPAGLLGIRVEKADDAEGGVKVKIVMPDSPAAKAGFKSGDRLLTLDGRWTDTVNDCYLAASLVHVGVPVNAEVLRDGKKIQLKVTVRAGL